MSLSRFSFTVHKQRADDRFTVIEDFFRLEIDVLLFFPQKAITSPLMQPILSAANASLVLMKEEPLTATLHYLRDFLAYHSPDSPSSQVDQPTTQGNPPEIQQAVKQLVLHEGENLTQRVMTGMMYSFPRDCFPDASGVLLALFQIVPEAMVQWIKTTIEMLPEGSMTPQESRRLLENIDQRVRTGEVRKIRTVLQDFTNSYRRRNVAPREGLGRLEATRFRFAG